MILLVSWGGHREGEGDAPLDATKIAKNMTKHRLTDEGNSHMGKKFEIKIEEGMPPDLVGLTTAIPMGMTPRRLLILVDDQEVFAANLQADHEGVQFTVQAELTDLMRDWERLAKYDQYADQLDEQETRAGLRPTAQLIVADLRSIRKGL